VASTSSTTKLFVDDLREVSSLSYDEGKSRSDVIRELVHEALRQRRLRALGRDESENHVRKIYQETVAEAVEPLLKDFASLRQQLVIAMAQSEDDAKSGIAAKTGDLLLTLLSHLLRRSAVTESIVKVLMTIGMQKDGVSAEEIRKQLAVQDEAGMQQARELTQKLPGDFPHAALSDG
jgi:predicted CopG family antitoxin